MQIKRLAHAWKGPCQWETLTQLAVLSWAWGCVPVLLWRKSTEWNFGRSLGKVFNLSQVDPWLSCFPTWRMSQFPSNSCERAGRASSPSPTAPWNSDQTQVAPDDSFSGHSPSPVALSAMEALISYAVQKGHLSSKYVQPLLVKGENCLLPLQKASPKKGKTFNPTGPPSRPTHPAYPLLISKYHWELPF